MLRARIIATLEFEFGQRNLLPHVGVRRTFGQCTCLRQQVERGAVQAEPGVDLAERGQQIGAHGGLVAQRIVDLSRAPVEYLARRNRVATRFAGIRHLEQRDDEVGGALRRHGLLFRELPLSLRFVAGEQGGNGEPGQDDAPQRRGGADQRQASMSPRDVALPQPVERHAEQRREDSEGGLVARILAASDIRSEGLGGGMFRYAPVRRDFEAQRRRHALQLRRQVAALGRGLPVDDQAQHVRAAPHGLEQPDFLVDPVRARRGRRADDDQELRLLQRSAHRFGEVDRGRQLLAVDEDRGKARKRRARRRRGRQQLRGNSIGLDPAVQPARRGTVHVAVADECDVASLAVCTSHCLTMVGPER